MFINLVWSNYNDLTRPISPKWWFSEGNPLISGKSGLVKYHNLPRFGTVFLRQVRYFGDGSGQRQASGGKVNMKGTGRISHDLKRQTVTLAHP